MSDLPEQRLLKIVQVSKYDSAGGGASRFAELMTAKLLEHHHVVCHFMRGSSQGFNDIRQPIYGKLTKKLMGKMAGFGWVDVFPFELFSFRFLWRCLRSDVIHFHDISATVSPITLWVLSQFKPVVWTLHDASVITAGCIQPIDCVRFVQGCGNCPQLGRWPLESRVDRTHFLRRLRRFFISKSHIRFVAPSAWLSTWVTDELNIRVRKIHNGIDSPLFIRSNTPDNPVPVSDKQTILIMSSNLDTPLKGTDIAIEAIKQLPCENYRVLVVGNSEIIPALQDYEVHYLGYIKQEKEKADVFALSDLLLFCSRAENYPTLLLESLICGCPVVAMDVGGVKEILHHDPNSVCLTDTRQLPAAIKKIIAAPRQEIDFSELFDIEQCLQQYLTIYSEIG